MSEKDLICSFCGLSKAQTNLLVAGQDAHICDSCIEQAYGIIIEESKRNTDLFFKSLNVSFLTVSVPQFLFSKILGCSFFIPNK